MLDLGWDRTHKNFFLFFLEWGGEVSFEKNRAATSAFFATVNAIR